MGTMLLQARGCTGLSTKPGTALASGKWVYPPVLPVHYRLGTIPFSGIYRNKLLVWKFPFQWVRGGEGCAKVKVEEPQMCQVQLEVVGG